MIVQHRLAITLPTSEPVEVRHFEVQEGLHRLFEVQLDVVSRDVDLDLDAIVGQPARFSLQRAVEQPERFWAGIVASIEQIEIDEDNLSTYRLVIRPRLWLLTQRRSYRVFQYTSDPDSALAVLAEWGIVPRIAYHRGDFLGRKYRVQYAESDYHFVRRLLEDAGITFFFEQHDGDTRLALVDGPERNEPRVLPVGYENRPIAGAFRELATKVRLGRRLRPGRYTQRDVDFRRSADFPLVASAGIDGVEAKLERFHQNYGAFLFTCLPDGASPHADDRGSARTDLVQAERQVERRLAAKRNDARRVHLETSAHDLAPGTVFRLSDHPRRDLSGATGLLVVSCRLTGEAAGADGCDWKHEVEASMASAPFFPPLDTRKPSTKGIESATVVGPDGEDIHTDEFGRVRVQFHWDRGGARDHHACCWVPVSQAWGGAGFGAVNIPRVGQEVIVDFLGADPDRPVIVGRVFTKTNPVPYALPEHKTVSGIRSRTSMSYVTGGAGAPAAAAAGPVVPPGAPNLMAMPSSSGVGMGAQRVQEALDNSLFSALSPNTETHRWSGSELTFDDRPGKEITYLQAQRDMSAVVKNNRTEVVGNQRRTKIGSDDVTEIDNEQLTRVGANRAVGVGGSQTHQVEGDVLQASLQGNQQFYTRNSFISDANHHAITSEATILLQVGDSCLAMMEDFVILQTPHLFLNPGQEETLKAIETRTRPRTPEEAAARTHRAAVAGAGDRLDTLWRDAKIQDRADLDLMMNDSDMLQFPDAARIEARNAFHAANVAGDGYSYNPYRYQPH